MRQGLAVLVAVIARTGPDQSARGEGFLDRVAGPSMLAFKLSGGRRWVEHGPIYGLTCLQIITKRINASLSLHGPGDSVLSLV